MEKSWPSAADFLRFPIDDRSATERARALAMPAGTRAQALQTRANSGGVAPASPQVAYRALLERCIGRSPKKVGRIFGPRRGLRLPAWPRLGDLIGSPRAPLRAAPIETAQHVVRLWHARAGTQTSASSLCWRVRG